MFVDSHCHLDRLKLDKYNGNLDGAIDFARSQGVQNMLCVGIDLETIDDVLGIAARYDDIYASVGVHPLTDEGEEPTRERLISLADNPKVIAIGETGLDYYYSQDHVEQQQQRFQLHMEVGKQLNKPVIVHTRDAREDTISLIEAHAGRESAGVLHCFTESWDMAKAALELNFYVSFSGIITFRNAEELRDVVRQMPMERMLIETDSPYLAPVPYRGKPNEPGFVPEVARCVAELKGLSVEEVAQITTNNFRTLFRLW